MTLSSKQHVAFGQIALGLSLFICLLLVPHYLLATNQGGVSNYGTNNTTRILFVFGFGAAALGMFVGATKLPAGPKYARGMKLSMYMLSVLYVLVLLSTFSYKSGAFEKQLHELSALVLFIVMLYQAVQIRFMSADDRRLQIAFIIFCAGWLAGILTAFEVLHVLFTAQILCGVSFGYMLTRILGRVKFR